MHEKEVTCNDIFVRGNKIAHRRVAGQTVIVDPKQFKVLRLNDTGSFVWDHLDGRSVSELVRNVMEIYEVDKETASQDTILLLKEFDRRHIVERLIPK